MTDVYVPTVECCKDECVTEPAQMSGATCDPGLIAGRAILSGGPG